MSWFERRNLRAQRKTFEEGFDFAAGQLLRGVDVITIENMIDQSLDRTGFDRGMEDALRAWNIKMTKISEYI